MTTTALLQPPTVNEQPSTTRGWISTTYRHYKGKRLGPYYFRKWKVGKKIHRQYVKPEDVERIRAECQAHREKQLTQREGTKQINRLLDNWDFLGRMYFQSEKKEIRPDQAAYVVRLHKEGMYIIGRPRYRLRRAFGVPLLANVEKQLARFKTDLLKKISQVFGDPSLSKTPPLQPAAADVCASWRGLRGRSMNSQELATKNELGGGEVNGAVDAPIGPRTSGPMDFGDPLTTDHR